MKKFKLPRKRAVLFGLLLGVIIAAAAGLSAKLVISRRAASQAKKVYLTFDDGPGPMTEKLLGVLAEKGVKATFFVCTSSSNWLELLDRISLEGHAIGVHSDSHAPGRIYSSLDAFASDVTSAADKIEEYTDVRPALYRYPEGSTSSHLPSWLRKESRNWLENNGYVYFDWNAVSGDQGAAALPPATLADNIIKVARKNDVTIALFHDLASASTTPDAVRLVIDTLSAEGCEFCALTPDTPPVRL